LFCSFWFRRPQQGKQYCDFAVLIFQTLIAVTIGGIFVTDRIVAFAQNAAQSYQDRRARILEDRQQALINDLYSSYIVIKRAGRGITMWNFPVRFFIFWALVKETLHTIGVRIPGFYLPMLTFRFLSSFPRGLYGFAALILFECLLLAQVAKTYFEYLPAC
jgi:hypothetical protein